MGVLWFSLSRPLHQPESFGDDSTLIAPIDESQQHTNPHHENPVRPFFRSLLSAPSMEVRHDDPL